MSLYAGDRSPKALRFLVSTGSVDGTDVVSATMRVRQPNGTEVTWAPSVTATTATSATLTYVLETDGTSVPQPGTYHVRAWLYDVGAALLLDTDEQSFQVLAARHTWPT